MTGAGFQSQFGGSVYGSSTSTTRPSWLTAGAPARRTALRLEAGTIRSNPTGNNGIVLVVPLARQVDNACLSYDVRFDANFDWSLGGKLPGLSGVAPGVSPTLPAGGGNPGDKGWSGRVMWGTNGGMTLLHVRATQVSVYGDGVRWTRRRRARTWHADQGLLHHEHGRRQRRQHGRQAARLVRRRSRSSTSTTTCSASAPTSTSATSCGRSSAAVRRWTGPATGTAGSTSTTSESPPPTDSPGTPCAGPQPVWTAGVKTPLATDQSPERGVSAPKWQS